MPETEWMTVLETADLMKTLPTKVTRMCEDGKLEYYKENNQLFISQESIDLFMLSQTNESTEILNNNIANSVKQESTKTEDFISEADHPTAFSNIPVEDASSKSDSLTGWIEGANGSLRRKYGKASVESDKASKKFLELQAEKGLETNNTEAEQPTDVPIEDTPFVNKGFDKAPDSVDKNETVITSEVENQILTDDSNEQMDKSFASLDKVEKSKQEERLNNIDQKDKPPNLEPVNDTTVQEETSPESSPTAPNDGTKEKVETPIYNANPAEQSSQESHQKISTVIPDNPTREVMEVLVKLRETMAQQASSQKVFYDEISSLIDTLENALLSNEDSTNKLTQEISSLLARYTNR